DRDHDRGYGRLAGREAERGRWAEAKRAFEERAEGTVLGPEPREPRIGQEEAREPGEPRARLGAERAAPLRAVHQSADRIGKLGVAGAVPVRIEERMGQQAARRPFLDVVAQRVEAATRHLGMAPSVPGGVEEW